MMLIYTSWLVCLKYEIIFFDEPIFDVSGRIVKRDLETLNMCIARKVAHYHEFYKEDNNGYFKWKSYR